MIGLEAAKRVPHPGAVNMPSDEDGMDTFNLAATDRTTLLKPLDVVVRPSSEDEFRPCSRADGSMTDIRICQVASGILLKILIDISHNFLLLLAEFASN